MNYRTAVKQTALLGTAAAVAGSALVGAPTAQAAAPGAQKLFVHGGSHMALFNTRADCTSHAAGWLPRLAKDTSKSLVPQLADSNETGPDQRAACFPLRSGKWTYLVAYFSTNGMLTKYDRPIDVNQRLRNPDAPQVDTENVYAYTHEVTKSQYTWAPKDCTASANNMVKAVRQNPHLRLIAGFGCITRFGTRTYATYYLGDSAKVGLYGDKADPSVPSAPMLDVLGYNYLINTPLAPPSSAAKATIKKSLTS